MRIREELEFDLDFKVPRITVCGRFAILENVANLVMISENAITVNNGKRFTHLLGNDFVIKEIGEGRMVVEGEISGVEFL